jgi:glycosyltransferase involved in cell wall biosynthesis
LISGCKAGTTFEYRVLQKKEQLALQSVETTVQEGLADHPEIIDQLPCHDWLYLYRLAYGPLVERMINCARAQGIPVIFDVDDLVFEPDLVHLVDPVKAMPAERAAQYYDGVWRYRQTLLASDYAVTATGYLADLTRGLGVETFVHRNGLTQWMIDEAEALRRLRAESAGDQVIIGYGSGTDTHRKDLAEITDALVEILTRYANVELHIVGPMELPMEFARFERRIRRLPLVPWREWLSVLNTFDINLSPLESGNPFCEAKSEIKYTEAALLGVPTVASRIRAYELAMRDGETGFLAGATDEWITKLERLVTNSGLRSQIGEAARSDVLARYTPEVLGTQLIQTLGTIQRLYARDRATVLEEAGDPRETPLVLNWVFPEPIPGSGGHADIIRMINLLSSFGHQNNAHIVPCRDLWDQSDLEIRESVGEQFAPLDADVFKWRGGPMVASDAVILTHWSTAHMIDRVSNTSKLFYFVQDWEPFFFPMGTEYLRAEQTYKMGFSCITLGSWLTQRLTEWYDADADYFDFAVDHEIFYPRAEKKPDRPRICFYARPSTPRRLFPMGVRALDLVHRARPDVEIVFYGVSDDELRRHRVPFPHTNLGILSEEELAELFSSCHLGIVLSPTNCSLVPPEMMACRCAVVDLNRETVRGVLENGTNAMLAESTPEGIAEAVVSLLDDESLRNRLVETAYEQVQERSWARSARKVEEILYRKLPASRCALDRRRREAPPPLPASTDLPAAQRDLLDAIHRKRRRAGARWRARLRGWAVRLVGGNRGIGLNGKPVHTVGELIGGRTIGQSFVARRDNLHRVDLLVGTFGRRNTRDVILSLKESPEAPGALATVRLNASLLTDNAYARFVFEPQPDSSGKSYYVCVESPESVPGDAVTLWSYRGVELTDARLYRNGRVSDGQLVFGLSYIDERLGEVGERPYLRGWTRSSALLWRRMEKAARLVSERDFGRLWQEVDNYWRWKTGRP